MGREPLHGPFLQRMQLETSLGDGGIIDDASSLVKDVPVGFFVVVVVAVAIRNCWVLDCPQSY